MLKDKYLSQQIENNRVLKMFKNQENGDSERERERKKLFCLSHLENILVFMKKVKRKVKAKVSNEQIDDELSVFNTTKNEISK